MVRAPRSRHLRGSFRRPRRRRRYRRVGVARFRECRARAPETRKIRKHVSGRLRRSDPQRAACGALAAPEPAGTPEPTAEQRIPRVARRSARAPPCLRGDECRSYQSACRLVTYCCSTPRRAVSRTARSWLLWWPSRRAPSTAAKKHGARAQKREYDVDDRREVPHPVDHGQRLQQRDDDCGGAERGRRVDDKLMPALHGQRNAVRPHVFGGDRLGATGERVSDERIRRHVLNIVDDVVRGYRAHLVVSAMVQDGNVADQHVSALSVRDERGRHVRRPCIRTVPDRQRVNLVGHACGAGRLIEDRNVRAPERILAVGIEPEHEQLSASARVVDEPVEGRAPFTRAIEDGSLAELVGIVREHELTRDTIFNRDGQRYEIGAAGSRADQRCRAELV